MLYVSNSPMHQITTQQLTGLNDDHIATLADGSKLHLDACSAWQAMQKAAYKDGIALAIASSYRDFYRQQLIWNKKMAGELKVKDLDNNVVPLSGLSELEQIKAILLFSALPATSRHHWGTEIDVFAPNLLPQESKLQLEPWEYEKDGPLYPLLTWLKTHASQFDFYFPYDQYRSGVAAEPWHISYAPIAQKCQSQMSADLVINTLSKHEISGYTTIRQHIDMILSQYVNNVGAP